MSDVDHGEPELDADALAMLRAYRAEERIPADTHERVWSRVQADVEVTQGQWLRYGTVVAGLAAAALAVLWMGGRVLRDEPRAPASQAGYERDSGDAAEGVIVPRASERVVPSRRAADDEPHEPPVPSTSPAPEDGAPGAAPSATTDLERAPSRAATSSEPSSARGGTVRRGAASDDRRPEPPLGSTLAAENRLLAQARAALVDAKPEQALARLGEHARRFPDGVLSEERQALRAVALCEAGRGTEGNAAAQVFLREHPQAALAERVRGACLD